MQRKSFVPFIAILLLLILAGLGYAGWKDGRQTGDKSWTPPALPATVTVSETPAPGWWSDLPSKPVIPTMPGRTLITASATGIYSKKTLTSVKTPTVTPTSTSLAATSTQIGNTTP